MLTCRAVPERYEIHTPENVTFEFELAGVASRGAAWAIDMVVMVALMGLASMVLQSLMTSLGGLAMAAMMVALFLVQWGYAALMEWHFGGRTIGKMVFRLRTLRDDGLPITFVQSVVRNLVRVVDLLPGIYLVGGVTSLLDPHSRRLGDIAAGTMVVHERRAPMPSAVVPASERYNTFIEDPAVMHAARRITPPERDAMIGLGLRREQLPIAVRQRLFARMSAHLEERLGVARPPFFSEEKYVLNLTAVVLDRSRD